jgi:asparagine synthase (glutamine-hydrolysing)
MVTAAAQPDVALRDRFRGALEALRHRGPDAQGQYQEGPVWLGHTRLSILDLSAAGSQPMRSDDGRYAISYNGEVYNFRQLAKEVGADDLRSRSDTEVVLRLFARHGVASLARLNGMFAFALHDKLARKLWLVRDRLGIKPLYYHMGRDGLAFASEIKGVIALTGETPACAIASLHEWLYYGNALGGRTLYEGIQQLLPGHYLELDLETRQYSVHEYWSLRKQAEDAAGAHIDAQAAVTETRRLLELAVQRQLISDVPVGVFLSGGVDSSAITAFAARHYEGRLATYSVGFDFATDGGELPKAKRVAEHYGTDHHEFHIAGAHVGELVEKMVQHHDLPFGDAANIPLYLMAREISRHTKVVLQGDGGDEVFGGYHRYALAPRYRLLHVAAKMLQRVHALAPESPRYHRIQRVLHALAAPDVAATIGLLVSPEDARCRPLKIFSAAFSASVALQDPLARFRELQRGFGECDLANQMTFLDLTVELPDVFLEKVDRSTMAASLEVRVPFLDHDLVDYSARLPGHMKVPRGRKKWLLKQALRGIVPDEVLDGAKTGFGVPFGRWLQTSLSPLFFDHLSRFTRNHPGILDAEHITTLFKRTGAGLQDHSPLVWKVLNFVVWANNSNIRLSTENAE